MSDKSCFLGIDLGTSSIKLVLIDENKKVLRTETIEYNVSQPRPGWREIDPEIWFECLIEGLDRIFSRFSPQHLLGIGVTGQMHTLVILDENGKPLRPAIMWDDVRTSDLINPLRTQISALENCEYIARTISTGSPAVNLFWMRENEPENYKNIMKFLMPPDYLVYRLTGSYGTDYCEASSSCLYDITNRRWSEPMREFLQLDSSVFPEVRASACSAGIVCPEISQRYSFREDIQVIVGTGDNPAAAISVGCIGRGYPFISFGTSGVLMMQKSYLKEDTKGKRVLVSLDDKNFFYLVQGTLKSNGGVYKWWNRDILGIKELSQIDARFSGYQAPDNDLLFFPHLAGEKMVYADADVRGAFLGLCISTTQNDMIYSIMEGLCYGFRELAEKMELDLADCERIRLVGGGSRSIVWAQILANVLNVTIEQMSDGNSAGFGIALLVAYKCGFINSVEEMVDGLDEVEGVFTPQNEAVRTSERKYHQYKRIYSAIKSVYSQ